MTPDQVTPARWTRTRRIARSARRRLRAGLLGWLAAVLAVVAGCSLGPSSRPPLVTSGEPAPPASSAAPRTPPTGPGGPGRRSDPVRWRTCATGSSAEVGGRRFRLDCAQIEVPKAYDGQDGDALTVGIQRARADGLADSAPPLVAVLGAPGENGVGAAASVAGSLPAAVTARFAVVTLDLRGTGDSVGVDCVSPADAGDLLALAPDPEQATSGDLLSRLSRDLTFDCTDEAGPDLTRFATTPAADDLDTVRAALGVPALTFLGRGHGATLGAVYAHRYPGRVAAMVLDGPADPRLGPDATALATAVAAEKALDTFAAACAGFSGGCPLGTDPRGRITALVQALGDVGITADGGRLVTGGTVLLALLLELPDQDRWPALASAIAALDDADSDPGPLADLVTGALGGDAVPARLSAALIYACNDTSTRVSAAALTDAVGKARTAAPLFGPWAAGTVALCADWPAPAAALGPVSGAGAPPFLVLGAVDDVLSPYSAVRSLAAQMPSAVLVSWQSGAHGAYPASACISATVDAYLLQHRVPAAGTLCPP
ncbi:alpha/beta hydrolase [Nakamurella endophytica]|uniref:Peptidase n=1 Tax=Nakamurella endophytica TaxID=1748367 RepID=A0A917TBK2_9ACTN|nr:alpha/beta hydrolase [Nakamurella endophytica]GGM16951.1 peptidase [Nakamurella endophytica]